MAATVLQPLDSPTSREELTSSYVPLRTAAANVVNRVKQTSSVAKYGVEKLETVALTALSFVPPPVVSRVTKYGSPVLEAVDSNLEYAYNRAGAMRASVRNNVSTQVDAARTVILNHQWFSHVDTLFSSVAGKAFSRAQLSAHDLTPLLTSFYVNASNQFLVLIRTGHETEVEFIEALKDRMHHVWTDRLNEPAGEFHKCALSLYNASRQHGNGDENGHPASSANEWTTKTLLQRLQPLLGKEWEDKVIASFQASVKRPAQLIYVASLQQYIYLSKKAAETGHQGKVKSTEFISSMQDRLGQAWIDSLEQPLKELLATWSTAATTAAQNTRAKRDSARDIVIEKWQYLLLAAQNIFDTVLPAPLNDAHPTVAQELMAEMNSENPKETKAASVKEQEEKVAMDEDSIHQQADPVTLTSFYSHVNERVRERGVVDNIRTASTNMVHTAVHTAMTLPYVEPVIKGVKSVRVQASAAASTTKPFVEERMKYVYETVHLQVESAYGQVKTNLEHLQHSLHEFAHHTKSTVEGVLHGGIVVTIHNSLPQSIQHALSELQNKLQLAVLRAKHLKDDGAEYVLEHRVTKLSRDLLAVASSQIVQVQQGVAHLSAEQITSLLQVVETAKHNVGLLVLWTNRQLALENGEEVDFELPASRPSATEILGSPGMEQYQHDIEESKEQEMTD